MKLLPSGKARFNWNIEAGLRKKFDDICETKGYSKQAHVERMIKEWIAMEEGLAQQPAGHRPFSRAEIEEAARRIRSLDEGEKESQETTDSKIKRRSHGQR